MDLIDFIDSFINTEFNESVEKIWTETKINCFSLRHVNLEIEEANAICTRNEKGLALGVHCEHVSVKRGWLCVAVRFTLGTAFSFATAVRNVHALVVFVVAQQAPADLHGLFRIMHFKQNEPFLRRIAAVVELRAIWIACTWLANKTSKTRCRAAVSCMGYYRSFVCCTVIRERRTISPLQQQRFTNKISWCSCKRAMFRTRYTRNKARRLYLKT